MYIVVDTEPDDIFEISKKNHEISDEHPQVLDITVMRKDRVAGIDKCYLELEPYEVIELNIHKQNVIGESVCLNDFPYWCNRNRYPYTETKVMK